MMLKISFICYLLSAISYLFLLKIRKGWINRAAFLFAIGGLIFNLIQFISNIFGPLNFSMIHVMLSLLTIFIIIIFFIVQIKYRFFVSGAVIMFLVVLITLVSIIVPENNKPIDTILMSFWFPVHVILTLLSYSAFTVAFCTSIGFLLHERNIKQHHLSKFYFALPSLDSLDELNYSLITAGIVYLTSGIVTGSVWAKDVWGSYWVWEGKQVFSLITWFIYIGAIHLRLFYGWRGRRTAYISILGFILMVLTFFGTNFFIRGLHSFF